MEVELGLKITQTREDLSSTADLRISKDAGGILFFSCETEVMFVLTGHLRGYRWKNITISISEDGTRVLISGEKPVQEKVIQGWLVYKKDVELRRFTKVFSIPRGVVLDKIKAKFKEEGYVLTISMPKSVKGITGEEIEEIKEVVDADMKSSASGVINETFGKMQHEHEEVDEDDDQEKLAEPPEATSADDHITEPSGLLQDTAKEERREENDQISEFKEEDRTRDPCEDDGHRQEDRSKKKPCDIFVPAMAGSALLMSLIVLVMNWKKPKQREI